MQIPVAGLDPGAGVWRVRHSGLKIARAMATGRRCTPCHSTRATSARPTGCYRPRLLELKREQWRRVCRSSLLPFAIEALAPTRHEAGEASRTVLRRDRGRHARPSAEADPDRTTRLRRRRPMSRT